jgi:hypothetical protein
MSLEQGLRNLLHISKFRLFHSPLAGSVGGPEKAGVGRSIPSLATMFSMTYRHSIRQFHSISFQNYGARMLASCGKAPGWWPVVGSRFCLFLGGFVTCGGEIPYGRHVVSTGAVFNALNKSQSRDFIKVKQGADE